MTIEAKKEICNCSKCENKECIHRECYRRMPREVGGLELCPKLIELKK